MHPWVVLYTPPLFFFSAAPPFEAVSPPSPIFFSRKIGLPFLMSRLNFSIGFQILTIEELVPCHVCYSNGSLFQSGKFFSPPPARLL